MKRSNSPRLARLRSADGSEERGEALAHPGADFFSLLLSKHFVGSGSPREEASSSSPPISSRGLGRTARAPAPRGQRLEAESASEEKNASSEKGRADRRSDAGHSSSRVGAEAAAEIWRQTKCRAAEAEQREDEDAVRCRRFQRRFPSASFPACPPPPQERRTQSRRRLTSSTAAHPSLDRGSSSDRRGRDEESGFSDSSAGVLKKADRSDEFKTRLALGGEEKRRLSASRLKMQQASEAERHVDARKQQPPTRRSRGKAEDSSFRKPKSDRRRSSSQGRRRRPESSRSQGLLSEHSETETESEELEANDKLALNPQRASRRREGLEALQGLEGLKGLVDLQGLLDLQGLRGLATSSASLSSARLALQQLASLGRRQTPRGDSLPRASKPRVAKEKAERQRRETPADDKDSDSQDGLESDAPSVKALLAKSATILRSKTGDVSLKKQASSSLFPKKPADAARPSASLSRLPGEERGSSQRRLEKESLNAPSVVSSTSLKTQQRAGLSQQRVECLRRGLVDLRSDLLSAKATVEGFLLHTCASLGERARGWAALYECKMQGVVQRAEKAEASLALERQSQNRQRELLDASKKKLEAVEAEREEFKRQLQEAKLRASEERRLQQEKEAASVSLEVEKARDELAREKAKEVSAIERRMAEDLRLSKERLENLLGLERTKLKDALALQQRQQERRALKTREALEAAAMESERVRASALRFHEEAQRLHQTRLKAVDGERLRVQQQLFQRQEELRRLQDEQRDLRETHEKEVAQLREAHREEAERLEDKRRHEEERALQTMQQLNAAVQHKEALLQTLQKDLQNRSLEVERHSQEAQLLKDLLNEARSQAAAEKEALQRQQSKISELDSQVARLHRKAEQQANAEEALKKQLLEEQRRLAKTEKDFDDRLAAAQEDFNERLRSLMQNEQTLRDEVSAQRKLLREGSLSSQEHLIAQHELSALKQELKDLLAEEADKRSAIQRQSDQRQLELQTKQQLLREVMQEKAAAEAQLQSLREEREENMRQRETERRTQAAALSRLQSETDSEKAKSEKLTREVEQLTLQMNLMEHKVETLQTSNAAQREALSERQRELGDALQKLEEERQSTQRLNAALEDAQSLLKRQQLQIEEQREKILQLQKVCLQEDERFDASFLRHRLSLPDNNPTFGGGAASLADLKSAKAVTAVSLEAKLKEGNGGGRSASCPQAQPALNQTDSAIPSLKREASALENGSSSSVPLRGSEVSKDPTGDAGGALASSSSSLLHCLPLELLLPEGKEGDSKKDSFSAQSLKTQQLRDVSAETCASDGGGRFASWESFRGSAGGAESSGVKRRASASPASSASSSAASEAQEEPSPSATSSLSLSSSSRDGADGGLFCALAKRRSEDNDDGRKPSSSQHQKQRSAEGSPSQCSLTPRFGPARELLRKLEREDDAQEEREAKASRAGGLPLGGADSESASLRREEEKKEEEINPNATVKAMAELRAERRLGEKQLRHIARKTAQLQAQLEREERRHNAVYEQLAQETCRCEIAYQDILQQSKIYVEHAEKLEQLQAVASAFQDSPSAEEKTPPLKTNAAVLAKAEAVARGAVEKSPLRLSSEEIRQVLQNPSAQKRFSAQLSNKLAVSRWILEKAHAARDKAARLRRERQAQLALVSRQKNHLQKQLQLLRESDARRSASLAALREEERRLLSQLVSHKPKAASAFSAFELRQQGPLRLNSSPSPASPSSDSSGFTLHNAAGSRRSASDIHKPRTKSAGEEEGSDVSWGGDKDDALPFLTLLRSRKERLAAQAKQEALEDFTDLSSVDSPARPQTARASRQAEGGCAFWVDALAR